MTISLQFQKGFARPTRRLDYCPSFPASTFDVCSDLVQVRLGGVGGYVFWGWTKVQADKC